MCLYIAVDIMVLYFHFHVIDPSALRYFFSTSIASSLIHHQTGMPNMLCVKKGLLPTIMMQNDEDESRFAREGMALTSDREMTFIASLQAWNDSSSHYPSSEQFFCHLPEQVDQSRKDS